MSTTVKKRKDVQRPSVIQYKDEEIQEYEENLDG